MDDARSRTPAEVFDSHLALPQAHDLEGDLRTNHAADVVLLTCMGTFRGHDGADSFVIRGGRIVGQTVHFTVDRK